MGAEGVRAWCVPWRGGAGPVPLTFVRQHTGKCLSHPVLHSQPCSPRRVVPLPSAVLQGALRCDGPQNYAGSSREAKRLLCITLLPYCPTAVQQPSTECSQAKPWLEGGEDGASPKSLCASPPTCAQLSPVPPWPLTARQALLSPQGFQGLQGGSRPSRREGRDPCGDFRPGGSSVPSVPCLRLSQKMPRREAPVPAVGAIEARTPRLRTAGREGRGCRPGVTTTGREPPQQRRQLPHPAGPVLKAPAGA